jgi:tetratricopeptide (TPR) repeat protein
LVFIAVLSVLSISRNRVWKDDMTLVTHDLPYMQNCSRAHFYHASLLKKEMTEKPSKKAKLEPLMIKEYKKSIEVSDSAYLSYLELGTYLCSQGRYAEGVPVLEKGTKIFPQAPEMFYYLGQSYVLLGRFQEAVPLLEKSLQLAYRNAHNYYFLAVAYSRTGKYDQALTTVGNGLQKYPDQQLMFYDAYANIYYDKGELNKSIEYSFKLIDLGKSPQEVYTKIITRCYEKGEKEKGDKYKAEARARGLVIQ